MQTDGNQTQDDKKPVSAGVIDYVDPTTNDTPIEQNVQEMLNVPADDKTGISDEDQTFMDNVNAKIESGEIDLYVTNSLVNDDVYFALSEEDQGKVDMNAIVILRALREIKGLMDTGNGQTFMIQNLIQEVREKKERVEAEEGNVYII